MNGEWGRRDNDCRQRFQGILLKSAAENGAIARGQSHFRTNLPWYSALQHLHPQMWVVEIVK